MRLKITLTALAIGLTMVACTIHPFNIESGSGTITQETREIGDFDRLEMNGFGEIVLEQGSTPGLVIEAEDNLLPFITAKVRGSTLEIGFKNNINVAPTRGIIYYLTVKDIHEMELSGGCSLSAGPLKTDHLTINMNGGGNIEIDELTTDNLKVDFKGAGSFKANGTAEKQEIRFAGAGGYDASNLKSQDIIVTIDGLSSTTLWAENTLDLTINGAGMISYYGDPHIVQHTAGVGNIKSLGQHR